MHSAKRQGLPSAKMRSFRGHPRFLASIFEVFFTCLPMIMPGACQSARSSMERNSTLLSHQTLVSAGGVFELGFYSANRSDVATPVFTLAVWYAQTAPNKTVVWFPDRSLALSEDASLTLSPQGDLQVHDNIGTPQLMWTSNSAKHNGTTATMLDTGNLVVLNSTNHVVWQSFDSPTDTLLPNQRYAANSGVTMIAWRASGDWRDSLYSLGWDIVSTLNASWWSKGDLYNTQSHLPFLNYWSYPTPSSSVFLTEQGEFLAVSKDYGENTLIGGSTSGEGTGVPNRLLRLTLDPDGNLRMYSWLDGSSEWEVEWEAIDDYCTIFAYCGPYAICSNKIDCNCPVGFQFINTTNPSQGCSRVSSEALCSITHFETIDQIDYDHSGDYISYDNVELEFCLQSCLADCSCEVAMTKIIPQGYGQCWLKNNILLNGIISLNRTAYMRVSVPPHHSSGLSQSGKINLVASTLGAGTVILGLLLGVFAGFSLSRKMKESRLRQLYKKWSAGKEAGVPVRFTFEEIQLITNNFAMEIGNGGFGAVFKGHIGYRTDHTDVAVKLLDEVGLGEKEFINKVDIIGQVHHLHLVNLLGYCAEGEHRILVSDYVEEDPLDRLLFQGDKSKGVVLEWRPRFQMAIQTAQALAYLHDDCHPNIVHCNVRPETIVVDARSCAKVADFGVSSIMTPEQIQTHTIQVCSSCEYLAPEWTNNHMAVTTKTDVFSFGMLLLELISGRRNLTTSSTNNHLTDLYFPMWAYPYIETASFLDVIDPSLTGIVDPVEVQRALLVAFWCINEDPRRRPFMAQVVQMLEGHVPVKVPVPRPNFLHDLRTEDDEDGPFDGHAPMDIRVPQPDFFDDVLIEDGEDVQTNSSVTEISALLEMGGIGNGFSQHFFHLNSV